MIAIGLASQQVVAAVVPPDQLVAGSNYGSWFAAFSRWFLEMPYDSRHPAQDRTGAYALRNQRGPVWFLVPAGTSSPVVRNITIPDDRWLFVDMTASICTTLDQEPYYGSNELECRECAEGFSQVVTHLEIDGEIVLDWERFLITSTFFDFVTDPAGFLSLPGGTAGQGVAYGAAVIVAPLPPGSHSIRFQSAQPDEGSSYNVTYNIAVYARPALTIRQIRGTSEIEISWPETVGFALQSSQRLDAGIPWSDVSLAASSLSDGTRSLRVAIGPEDRYFRLVRP